MNYLNTKQHIKLIYINMHQLSKLILLFKFCYIINNLNEDIILYHQGHLIIEFDK